MQTMPVVAVFVVLLYFVQAYTQKTASSGEGAAEWTAQMLCRRIGISFSVLAL